MLGINLSVCLYALSLSPYSIWHTTVTTTRWQNKRPAGSYSGSCTTPSHRAGPCWAFDVPNVHYTTLTVMKSIHGCTLAMRKCLKRPPKQGLSYLHFYCHYRNSAKNKQYLRLIGVTHVLNTAEGTRFGQVDTGHSYYRDMSGIR